MNQEIAGEKNGRAKLNERKVREIREHWQMFAGRIDPMQRGNSHIVSTAKLANEYKVCQSTMFALVTGKTWRHVR